MVEFPSNPCYTVTCLDTVVFLPHFPASLQIHYKPVNNRKTKTMNANNINLDQVGEAPTCQILPSTVDSSTPSEIISTAVDSETSKILKTQLLKNIATLPAKRAAMRDQKLRVSRRLLLADREQHLTVNCPTSGITSLIQIPAIPYKTLIWESPLADLSNCRGLVQEGIEYLRKLDTQTLAGILLVMADDYSLFRYQPGYSAAQKNAIIRTAGKDTIINAALFVEDYVHSKNRTFLPKLSLILENTDQIGSTEARMTEWLKLVASIVYRQDFASDEDEFYNEVPKKQMTPQYVTVANKKAKAEDWAATNKKWAEQREFKADIKSAKDLIKTFAKEETVSSKLVGLLKSVFTDDALLTMDSSMRFLLSSKMGVFETEAALKLTAIIKKPYAILRESAISLDLDSLDDSTDLGEATNAPIDSLDSLDTVDAEEQENTTDLVDATNEIDSRVSYDRRADDAKPASGLSIIEKIKARKLAEAMKARDLQLATIAAQAQNKTNEAE